jgi:hypothetical protein
MSAEVCPFMLPFFHSSSALYGNTAEHLIFHGGLTTIAAYLPDEKLKEILAVEWIQDWTRPIIRAGSAVEGLKVQFIGSPLIDHAFKMAMQRASQNISRPP